MIHNRATAPFTAEILKRAARENGVGAIDCGASTAYFYKLAYERKVFTTPKKIGSTPKRYFDTQERADAFYASWAPSKNTHPKASKAAMPVDFKSKTPTPGGPARMPGEMVITAATKITVCPSPSVSYRTNTHSLV